MKSRLGSARGITSIEMLAVLGISSLLLALLVPTLVQSRDTALQTTCATTLSSHWKSIVLYTDANHGRFPTWDWTKSSSTSSTITTNNPWLHPSGYAAVTSHWHELLADDFQGDKLHNSLVCPGDHELDLEYQRLRKKREQDGIDYWRQTSYSLAFSLFLSPATLSNDRYTIDSSSFLTQRIDSIRFPTSKGVMKDPYGVHETRHDPYVGNQHPATTNVAGADGHVKFRSSASFIAGVVYNDPRFPSELWPEIGKAMAIDFTRNGIYGRDW